MHQVYCTAPWQGLTIREDGNVKVCCAGEVTIGNLNQQSIHDILKGDQIKIIQRAMLNGLPHAKNCSHCLQQEKNTGVSSIRQHYNRSYPIQNFDQVKLSTLDVRWNNTCNLACLYCSPQFSSTWCERLKITNLSPVKNYQDELLEFILADVDSIQEIMLVGGEPMLMKQNYQLIHRLPTSTKVSIITNLNYDLENLPCFKSLIDHPNILWNVSCENTHEQFEYVRAGAKWETIKRNIKLLNQYWPNNTTINMVYSMFSAFDIESTVEEFCKLDIKKFNLQTISGNSTIDVFNMPKEIKLQALDVLNRAEILHKQYIHNTVHLDDQEFYSIQNISFVKQHLENSTNSAEPVKLNHFNTHLSNYNQWSSKKFEDLWPHVINLVNQYLD